MKQIAMLMAMLKVVATPAGAQMIEITLATLVLLGVGVRVGMLVVMSNEL